jgi:RNA recognition motif. (a.k.a. RRM, RBD, or RNP domain)
VTVDGQTATVEARKGPRGRTPRTAQPTQPQGTSSSIYIRAVEPGVTREDVAGLFAPYGSVLNTQLRDSVNGRRYAFVQFEVSLCHATAYVHVCVHAYTHTSMIGYTIDRHLMHVVDICCTCTQHVFLSCGSLMCKLYTLSCKRSVT